MIPLLERNQNRKTVHTRIRRKMQGTAERPRLNVYRSLNHIYAQVIDDLNGVTLVSASSAEGKRIFDSDQITEIETLPREIIVVGAGVIGLEFASMFAALNVEVTLIDARPTLLDGMEYFLSRS